MYTLDETGKKRIVKKLNVGPNGYIILESNSRGHLIVQDNFGFWMSVPQLTQVHLYPMRKINDENP